MGGSEGVPRARGNQKAHINPEFFGTEHPLKYEMFKVRLDYIGLSFNCKAGE